MVEHRGRIKFLHIPKTGGTSIAKALKIEGPHDNAIYRRTHDPDWDESFRFTVIRNPWDQVFSWYMWDSRFLKWSFPEWVRLKFPTDSTMRGIHPVHQREFFCDENGKELVHVVLRFETLALEFDFMVREILRMEDPPELPFLNATPLPMAGRANMPSTVYRYARVYDGETWTLVERYFEPFIRHYGYAVGRSEPVNPSSAVRRCQREWEQRRDKLSRDDLPSWLVA